MVFKVCKNQRCNHNPDGETASKVVLWSRLGKQGSHFQAHQAEALVNA